MSPFSKNSLIALAALLMAMGVVSASRASDIVDPPVFASSNGLLDLLMIAQPGAVTGLTFEGFAPTGWFYTVCQRPAKGNTCPNDSGRYCLRRVPARAATWRRIEDPAYQ